MVSSHSRERGRGRWGEKGEGGGKKGEKNGKGEGGQRMRVEHFDLFLFL